MSVKETKFITISCDGPACDKTVTFEATQDEHAKAKQDNAWLASNRIIQTPDGRQLGYCSDVCEAEGIKSGTHNILEKRIIPGANESTVNLAAQAAKRAAEATAALKQGSGVTLG